MTPFPRHPLDAKLFFHGLFSDIFLFISYYFCFLLSWMLIHSAVFFLQIAPPPSQMTCLKVGLVSLPILFRLYDEKGRVGSEITELKLLIKLTHLNNEGCGPYDEKERVSGEAREHIALSV